MVLESRPLRRGCLAFTPLQRAFWPQIVHAAAASAENSSCILHPAATFGEAAGFAHQYYTTSEPLVLLDEMHFSLIKE